MSKKDYQKRSDPSRHRYHISGSHSVQSGQDLHCPEATRTPLIRSAAQGTARKEAKRLSGSVIGTSAYSECMMTLFGLYQATGAI